MLQRLPRLWRNVSLAIVGALTLWFLWTVRGALNPLGVGLLFAYMLHPLVGSLERRGWSRKAAVNFIFGATAVGGVLLSLALLGQARTLWNDVRERGVLSKIDDRLSEGAETVNGWLEGWNLLERFKGEEEPAGPDPEAGSDSEREGARETGTEEVAALRGPGGGGESAGPDPNGGAVAEGRDAEAASGEDAAVQPLQELYELIAGWFSEEGRLEQAGEAGLRAAGGAWTVLRRVFGSLLAFLGYVVLVPVYTWFLLFELERISSFVRKYIPRGERERFASIGGQITEMLGNFFRGRMLVCLLKGLVLATVLRLAGFPYSLLIGVLSGFLSLVPFVGPFVGYGLAFLLGLLEFSLGECVVRMAIVYAIGEVVEGYVLLPRVLGDSMGLHPIVVIASLMVFGAALGMFGMLLALPLTSAVVIVARELVLPALEDFAEETPGGKPAGEAG